MGKRWWSGMIAVVLAVAGGLWVAGARADGAAATGSPVGEAPVVVRGRTVTVLRAPFLGVAPQERARRVEARIVDLLDRSTTGAVGLEPIPQGVMLTLDGSVALILTPGDADAGSGERFEAAAESARKALERLVEETRESRSLNKMLWAVGLSLLATAILWGVLWVLWRLRSWVALRMAALAARQAERLRLAGQVMDVRERLTALVRVALAATFSLLALVFAYWWLSFVLARFPLTRAWAEHLDDFLLTVVTTVGGGVLRAIPDLVVAATVFAIAYYVVRGIHAVFGRVEGGQLQLDWMPADLASPTRKLASVAVWLFAVAMAYPYLPGAQTEAFKGLSVLVGLMVSLGASSIVGHAASGLILMYSRTIRLGEFVKVADCEGTVVGLGMFSTRIRTGLGEELSIANSMVLGSVTRNYSRAVKGCGFIVDTTVTIGYDTPWRQVHAMLELAAKRTPGVLADPAPQVFQTALSDFYVEYRLVCQAVPSEPRPRAEVLANLHAQVQDVFNEFGVQIMSPHYLGDPADAKRVPRDKWFEAPAVAPEGGVAEAGPGQGRA